MRMWLAAVALLTALAAQAQVPPARKEAEFTAAGHKRLTGAEIVRTLAGNTVYVVFLEKVDEAERGSVVKIYHRDQKVRVTVPAAGPKAGQKFEASWWIEGNFYCAEQRLVMRGHTCSSMYMVESSIYSCLQPAGECKFLLRVVPGNPENI